MEAGQKVAALRNRIKNRQLEAAAIERELDRLEKVQRAKVEAERTQALQDAKVAALARHASRPIVRLRAAATTCAANGRKSLQDYNTLKERLGSDESLSKVCVIC
eukprot:SAG31_NODE_6017_length_2213_cov_1.150426_3_plen_105_part_00